MKRSLYSIVLILISLFMIVSFSSCQKEKAEQNPEDRIAFGENYVLEGTEPLFYADGESYRFVLVFYQDGTGKYEIYHNAADRAGEIVSGTIRFVWKTASDGAIYLFEKERSYNDDHQPAEKCYEFDLINILITSPLYVGEDFLTCTIDRGDQSKHPKFIRENSELAN